jgi:propionate CoA-transferase
LLPHPEIDNISQGVGHLGHPGMVKRIVAGALVNSPVFQELAKENKVEAYTLPQGSLSELMREMAAGRPGLLTQTGLHTFVDPRISGGRQSECAQEELVELVQLAGAEWLFYKPYKVDVAFLRGTTADEDGNVTMEREAVLGEMLSLTGSVGTGHRHRPGGAPDVAGTCPPSKSRYLDAGDHTSLTSPADLSMDYSPAYARGRVPYRDPFALDVKVIIRRAAMELRPGGLQSRFRRFYRHCGRRSRGGDRRPDRLTTNRPDVGSIFGRSANNYLDR